MPNTLLSVFSAACNLDSEESSTTCHNLPVLLLLSRRWSLAVAVLLQHLMKNSVPINRKKMEEYWSQKNSNASQMQPQSQLWQAGKQKARKPISTNRNRQKAPESAWISATLSFSCCTSYEVEPKWIKMNQNEPKAIILVLQTCLFLKGCKTISCYFMLFHQRATCLQRGLAFQVLQLLSMLFSSSSRRWGMLCLPSKRSFEKSWNIVRRPIDIDMN